MEPTPPPDLEAIIGRVERLWRQARNTPYPAEAEAFEQKALRLMAHHQISMAMLDIDGSEALVDLQVGEPVSGRYGAPLEHLFGAVCEAHDCVPWFRLQGDGYRTFFVTGFRADAERVRFVHPLLAADALSRAAALPSTGNAAATMRRRRNFLFGYASALAKRVDAARQRAIEEHAEATGDTVPGVELVLVGRRRRVDERIAAMRLRSRRPVQAPGADGFEAGRRAGEQADLSGGRHRVGHQRQLDAAG